MKKRKTASLLFEIGVEEIPSGYFAGAEASIRSKAPELLAECGFQFDRLEIHTTPRRLVLYAANFRFLEAREEEKLGPMKDQAYQNGEPTPALLGFLKSTGCRKSDVFLKDTPRGARVCVKVKKEYQPLRYFFETIPLKIEFPKLMRWEKSRYPFTRPIRWTFAFVGNKEQKYQIADVKSSHFTYGHRFLSPKPIRVFNSDLKTYEKLLAKHHVILRKDARIQRIRGLLKAFHQSNEELISTVVHLVEEPYPVIGVFDKKYLKLPSAVLVICMSKNQKVFACYDTSGRLQNRFLAVINGKRKDTKTIAKHYESVLVSRLEDAEFFFKEDNKTKLEAKVQKLKEMVFLGSLGSYWDKTKRLEALVQLIGEEAKLSSVVVAQAQRAAYLAKADLTTHLVYEFPELQGAAGFEYAKLDGENEAVAKAIQGHYFPTNLAEDFGDLKKRLNLEGALVGISDRIDLLVGASLLGVEFSASQDPYALRRSAGGIVKILRAHPIHFSLSKLMKKSQELFGHLSRFPKKSTFDQLTAFFKDRIVFELQLKAGTKEYDLLRGIFASGFDDLANVYDRYNQLSKNLNQPWFEKARKVSERTANILKGIPTHVDDQVNPSFLKESLEKELYDILNREAPKISNFIANHDYSASTKLYGELFYDKVHDFFDQVMVNVEDPKIRSNRQALVRKINRILSDRVADLSQIKALEQGRVLNSFYRQIRIS